MTKNITLYEILQVSESAPPEIIRAAYLTLAKKYHPDLCQSNPEEAQENMKAINAAYEILSNPTSRSQYDAYLRNQRIQQKEETLSWKQSTYNTMDFQSAPTRKNQNKTRSVEKSMFYRAKLFLLIPFFLCFLLSVIIETEPSDSKTSTSSQTASLIAPVDEPRTGTILSGYAPYDASQITVTAPHTESCVVKLKNTSGDTELCFYVRSGETATLGVPRKNLFVYFASGETWYGEDYYFGENTYYSKDKGVVDFYNNGYSYTLYPVTNGNFSATTIDADEFFDK